jgi:hypothetical protein
MSDVKSNLAGEDKVGETITPLARTFGKLGKADDGGGKFGEYVNGCTRRSDRSGIGGPF